MHTDTDHELLRRYAEQGDEGAFTELVQRHLNLVWAAALRVSGNPELARDVAQTVFTDLARKAGSLPQDTILAGWLYRAACLAATNQVRGETRRVLREQHAMATQDSICSDSTGNHAAEALQPLLDSALAELSEADRDAVVLRFLAGRSLAEVGAALGTSEDAAQKRVSRALDKLREAFRRRGVNVAGGTLAAALGLAAAETAPIGAASGITAGALASVGVAGGTGTWLLIMKSKLTLGIVGGAAVVAALSWQQLNLNRITDENSALRAQLVATSTASPPLRTTNPTEAEALARLEALQEELLRLRGEVAQLRLTARQPTANAATAPKLTPEDIDALATEKLVAEATATKIIDAMKKLGVAARIFALDNQDRLPTTFEEFESVLAGFPSADDILRGGALRELLEFFPDHERAISEAEPQMILFQEKKPRRLPNGTWERIYCLTDSSVLRINRPDGNFSEFELPRTATPANAPAKP